MYPDMKRMREIKRQIQRMIEATHASVLSFQQEAHGLRELLPRLASIAP